MSLAKYKEKRRFNETPEPQGKTAKTRDQLIFTVQRHHASHLHYDFRLELNGVLKSWAVPKGPSLNPKDKRLAMMVEDHPKDYASFEGDIPEGNYGAGHVDVWDHGTYEPIDEKGSAISAAQFTKNLKAGSIKFRLKGKKLKGDFALVHMNKGERTWLLIKHRDQYATDKAYNSEDYAKKSSLSYTAARKTSKAKTPVKKKDHQALLMSEKEKKASDYIVPMMAKEIEQPFNKEDWLFEIKWDGYRAIAEINGKNIRLYSRHGNSFLQTYPPIAAALKKIKQKAIIDGEIVVLNEEGNPDFQLLQQYQENPDQPIVYYVFDLLSLKGKDTMQLTLIQRKELLKQILPKDSIIRYSDHVLENGKDFFNVSVQHKLEGTMAKRVNSKYYPGVRTADWLKIKSHRTQEVIIAGYTQPTGTRKYFGAIILAIKQKGELIYVGHSGSGFNQKSLKEMWDLLQPLVTNKSPFQKKVKTNTPVTWVKPVLIAEVKYSEWTQDGILRHPIFLRLRTDKPVNEANMTTVKKTTKDNAHTLSFGKVKVNITNRNKLFWPEEKYTKGDVIDYYQEIADYILPYLKNRPQSLLRNPNGIKDRGFFHKDAGDEAPSWVKSIPIYSESNDEDINYIICNDKATLAYLNNLGCIEINPWNSTIKSLEKPDYMIIDIDPSKNNTFDQVVQVAQVIKKILDEAGAESYCKTSGATGLHVFVPMGKKYIYEQVKDFCHIICRMVQEQLPDFTTLERNLKKRGNKHIYMDYLQNRKGQTISSVYSLRPKSGAPVSTPLQWKEVRKGLNPAKFTIKTIHKRLQQYGDLFAGVMGRGIDMKKCLEKLGQ